MSYFKLQALNDQHKDRQDKSMTEKSLKVIKNKYNHICIKKSLRCMLLKTGKAFWRGISRCLDYSYSYPANFFRPVLEQGKQAK